MKPGDLIGEISQDELKDQIHEAETRLANLKRDDEELTRFEQQEKETQDTATARLKQVIQRQGELTR